MTFTFDVDKALKRTPSVANPAKSANPDRVPEGISSISSISKVAEPGTLDYTTAELQEMDALLRELAELEAWTTDELEVILDERRRMAPVSVRKALAALRVARAEALAPWPDQPTKRARITLCELTSRRRQLTVLPGKADSKELEKSSGKKAA